MIDDATAIQWSDEERRRDARLMLSGAFVSCKALTGREKGVLFARYWMQFPLSMIGDALGVCRNRAQQIEKRALLKLRQYFKKMERIEKDRAFVRFIRGKA